MTKEQKQEYATRVSQANRSELVVIIYEVVLAYMEEASQAIAQNKKEELEQAIDNARSFVNQLMGSLNYSYNISHQLYPLYSYVDRLLVTVRFDENEEELKVAKDIMDRLYQSFSTVAKEDDSPALMKNVETIYAGMTYGREHLNENISDDGNRGFVV